MGGVDRVDENIEHHRISVRGKNGIFPFYHTFSMFARTMPGCLRVKEGMMTTC